MKETPFHRFLYKIDSDSIPPSILVICTLLWFGYFMTFMNFKYKEYREYPCIGIEQKHNNDYIIQYGTKIKESTWNVEGIFTTKIYQNSSKDKTKYKVIVYENRDSEISLFGFGNKNTKVKNLSYKLKLVKE